MYEQIAQNKRRAVLYVVVFFVVWVAIGALVGWVAASTAAASGTASADGTVATTSGPNVGAAVLVGAAIAATLAALGVVYTMTAGSRLVLAVSGAVPADPVRYRQLHDVVEALAIGDGLPKPQVYVIDDPSPNAFATGTSPTRRRSRPPPGCSR